MTASSQHLYNTTAPVPFKQTELRDPVADP